LIVLVNGQRAGLEKTGGCFSPECKASSGKIHFSSAWMRVAVWNAMKTPLFAAVLSFTSAVSLLADSNIVLTGVHNCCKKCDTGITEAVAKVDGASAKTEKRKVTITAKDEATAKLAVQSLVKNGYFGEGAVAPVVGDQKVKSATVNGLHLCCGKCVTAAEEAVLSVPGVTGHNAEKGAASFKVDGDFSTQQLAAALHKAGLHGEIK
jgi:hypothetical protein